MRFEWDDSKAWTNATKHKVSFEEASTVWTDPFAQIAPDPDHSTEEIREWIIGTSYQQRVLVIVYTGKGESIRIISARKATPMSGGVMKKKIPEFPFASARRITAQEVTAAEEAVREQFGIEPPKRGRPAKDESERYEPVSIRLHPKVIEWAKEEAAEQGVGYQTVINEALLKLTLPHQDTPNP